MGWVRVVNGRKEWKRMEKMNGERENFLGSWD